MSKIPEDLRYTFNCTEMKFIRDTIYSLLTRDNEKDWCITDANRIIKDLDYRLEDAKSWESKTWVLN